MTFQVDKDLTVYSMQSIEFKKTTLSNGLDVILHKDSAIPVVGVNVWYHVGSKDEEPGKTGFAHLFEHVMFEGSKNHNESHFDPLQKVGASLNGSTTSDRTNYWEDVPSNALELALWLESDRMGFLLDALDQKRFDIQRDVVKNERRQSYENRPYGMASWNIQGALFPLPHPYHWMTIGSQEDLDAASLDDVKDFFRRFYHPSNASLSIAGDIEYDRTLEMVEKYFGGLPPGNPVQRFGQYASSLPGRIELEISDNVTLPRVYIAWPTPPGFTKEDPALELLSDILSDGLSSRLHRSLVYEQQIAQSVGIRYHSSEISGQFVIDATPSNPEDIGKLEEAVDNELKRIWTDPPTDDEIARVKNRLEAQHFRQLTRIGGFGGRADALNYYNVFAKDPNLINTEINEYMSVTREDILRVYEEVLTDKQVRLKVLPEPVFQQQSSKLDRTVKPDSTGSMDFVAPMPQKQTLSNGLGLTIIEKPGVPVVSFALVFNSGTISDPQHSPGLSSFTAQMLSEGTQSKSSQQIAEAFEYIGARLNTETRRESTVFSTETLTKHWATALELVAEILRFPTFPQDEFERVQKEHLTDLMRAKDDPTFISEQNMSALIFGKDSGYGHPAHGTEESVRDFRREDLVAHFETEYSPEIANLIVVGDVSCAEVVDLSENIFKSWTNDVNRSGVSDIVLYRQPERPSTIFLIDKPGAAQSVIRAGHVTVPRDHEDYFSLQILNFIFGGQFSARLNQNLRQDKGYSYGFHSSISWYKDQSMIVAGGSVQTDVTKESVIEVLREFRDITDVRPITEDELVSAQGGLLQGYPSGFERSGQILGKLIQLVTWERPDDYFTTLPTELQKITLSDIHRVGSDRIKQDGLSVLVVGDRARIEEGLRTLDVPIVLLDVNGEII